MDSTAFVDQALQSYQASQTPTNHAGNSKKAARQMSNAQIDAVAQDFEAFFVSIMDTGVIPFLMKRRIVPEVWYFEVLK